jgi:hypothetical protein
MALFDLLKNKQKPKAALVAPKQEQIQQTLQTKATGKAVTPGAGPKASAIGEAQAVDTLRTQEKLQTQSEAIQEAKVKGAADRLEEGTQEQRTQMQFEHKLKQEGIKLKEAQALTKIRTQEDLSRLQREGNEMMKVAAQAHAANQAFYQISQQTRINTLNLTAEMGRAKKQLETDRQMAQLEQVAFVASLRSKEYIQKINQIGKLQRLNDDAVFKEESLKATMGHRSAMLYRQHLDSLALREKSFADESRLLEQERQQRSLLAREDRAATAGRATRGRGFDSLINRESREARAATAEAERTARSGPGCPDHVRGWAEIHL